MAGSTVLPVLTCVLRELGSAARQAVPGHFQVVAPKQSRGDKNHVQKEKRQEQQLHPACNSRHARAKVCVCGGGKQPGCNSCSGCRIQPVFASTVSLTSFKKQELHAHYTRLLVWRPLRQRNWHFSHVVTRTLSFTLSYFTRCN